MEQQNLSFNILTFDWPKEPVKFYFNRAELKEYPRLHKRVFPNNIDSIFPGLNNSDQKFIGCTYDGKMEGFTALPIDLITFNAKQFDEVINLNWKTANEKQFSHFELQRSADAKEFGTITSIDGNKLSIYNHTDANPLEGQNYYRLKMIDTDGSSKLSNIISVSFEKGGSFVSVENPSSNGEIKMMTNLVNPNFQLMASNGAKLSFKSNRLSANSYVLIADNAPAGVYFLHITSNGKMVIKKIVNK